MDNPPEKTQKQTTTPKKSGGGNLGKSQRVGSSYSWGREKIGEESFQVTPPPSRGKKPKEIKKTSYERWRFRDKQKKKERRNG